MDQIRRASKWAFFAICVSNILLAISADEPSPPPTPAMASIWFGLYFFFGYLALFGTSTKEQ